MMKDDLLSMKVQGSWFLAVMARGVTNQDVDQRSLARLKSIDIISAGQAVPIVLAITVEE